MKRTFHILLFAALAILAAACAPAVTETPAPTAVPEVEPTSMPEPMSIVDIAVADGRFQTLVTALESADLVGTLDGSGPFTVFAPTDDAFAKLPAGTVEALLQDQSALTDILLYHVVGGQVLASDVVSLNSADTLLGAPIEINFDGAVVRINDAEVVFTDIQAANGVIHVIDTVLLPPAEPTIIDVAVADGRFTTLLAAVDVAGLTETLAGEGPLTVFAPTDEAFAALPDGTVDALLNDIPLLTDILLYHVVSGEVASAQVTDRFAAETVQGQSLTVNADGGEVRIDDAQVIIPDIQAANGIIHVIDSVLLPPDKTIAELAVADGRFTTLVAALDAAGLVETLQGEGPFTVFAPTDEAFAALPAGTVEALLEDIPALTDILLYHVVPGQTFASEVITLNSADTAQGQPVLISIADGAVFINDAQVILTDIKATNGVIHVIDSVILPPSKDIVTTAVEDGRFTTLVTAVEAAGLVEALQADGPLTVFAPTDEAFSALPAGTIEALLDDIPALTDILLYHIVDGRVLSGEVVELNESATLQGQSISISVVDGQVFIDEAQVIITDILTSNGVIHVIDTVLIPPA